MIARRLKSSNQLAVLTRPAFPRRFSRLTALASATALVASLVATPAGAKPRTVATSRPAAQVVLPTGERLTLQWQGDRPRIGRLPGDHTPMSFATVGNHVYAIPVEAGAYFGSAFDRSLFDVTELAAKEGRDGTGPIPVSLTLANASVSVPGVRITSRSGRHATGYLDPRSAAFGAAVRDRLQRGPAAARKAGMPVAGLSHLALDAPTGGGTVHPDFPQVTLTVRLIPPAGKTVLDAVVFLANTDDGRKYSNFVGIGPENYAKVSVPKGHYAIVGTVVTGAGREDAVFCVPIVVDYTVRTNEQSVTIDANRATAVASFSTPQPSELLDAVASVIPTDRRRQPAGGMVYIYDAEDGVRVAPTPKPKYGGLAFSLFEYRSHAPAAGAPFDYHLVDMWSAGIPANPHRAVRADELARIDDQVYAVNPADSRAFGRAPDYPNGPGVEISGPETKATHHVDYVYGQRGVKWTASAYQFGADSGESMWSPPIAYRAGRTYQVNWFRGLVAPGFIRQVPFPGPYCVACRTAGEVSLVLNSELDADPSHFGSVGGRAEHHSRFQVFRDGTSIVDVADTDAVTFPVPTAMHTYRIEETVDRAKLGFSTSTKMRSVYTVRSSSTSGRKVPANWDCFVTETDPACTVLPVLTTNVPLPIRPDNTVPVGTSRFVVQVGHVAPETWSAITQLTFATSLDGTTFRPAKVTCLGNGRFRVTLTNPVNTAGHQVSIQLHAKDAAGATVTQTVVNAYSVNGSSS
jgi:hypothetical protein